MKPAHLIAFVLAALTGLPLSPLPAFAGRNPEPAADSASSSTRRAGIVAFCRKNRNKKVGDGECWALANEAFKQTGARRPGREIRVWGRQINLRTESPLPGDILECDRTRFADGSYTTAQHTAVIMAPAGPGTFLIAEQNFAGKKKVKERVLDLRGVRSGSIAVYRPQ